MTQENNYQEIIQQGIPLIQEWISKQSEEINQLDDFKELTRVIDEIENEKDYSKDAYLDIRYVLKPFNNSIPLQLKRIFNVSTIDNYCAFISSRWFENINDFINLELCTSKFNGNMTKFFYNPISLTETTRPFFTHLRTLYLYSIKDNRFENDKRIIGRELQFVPYYLKKRRISETT
jgi:hypothetical protein